MQILSIFVLFPADRDARSLDKHRHEDRGCTEDEKYRKDVLQNKLDHLQILSTILQAAHTPPMVRAACVTTSLTTSA